MALQPRTVFIPAADSPGMTFQISYYKPDGRPGIFCAVEGEFNDLGNATTFKYQPTVCRRVQKQLDGRATKVKLQGAYRELLAELRQLGYIAPGEA